MSGKPVVLMILDGFGLNPNREGNAIAQANAPTLHGLLEEQPVSRIDAAGTSVGLPEGQIGNSEVGHMNIGAGRIVHQPLTRINEAIRSGDFFANRVLGEAFDRVKAADNTLHLMGLVSDGGVHSHQDHVRALLEMAQRRNLTDRVAVHAFLDGRDVPPRSAKPFLKRLRSDLDRMGVGTIATVSGRYYAMDRDKRWDRTRQAYDAMVLGASRYRYRDAIEALEAAYERDENDEFVQPTVLVDEEDRARSRVEDGDSVVFFNFRPDRARQLTRAFTEEGFSEFDRTERSVFFTTLTEYDEEFDLPVAYPPLDLRNVLGERLSDLGLKQYRTAETEKYAHVTFFLNGGREDPFPGEERTLIPSPKVATYDQQPEMSAPEITEALVDRLESEQDDLLVVNYANPDMVGHTGDLGAAIEAIEALDECVQQVLEAVRERGGEMLITSDHGNCELMIDPETGGNHTAHTTNPVPLIYVNDRELALRDGGLADIAPTLLELLDVEVPEEMTGHSLIVPDTAG